MLEWQRDLMEKVFGWCESPLLNVCVEGEPLSVTGGDVGSGTEQIICWCFEVTTNQSPIFGSWRCDIVLGTHLKTALLQLGHNVRFALFFSTVQQICTKKIITSASDSERDFNLFHSKHSSSPWTPFCGQLDINFDVIAVKVHEYCFRHLCTMNDSRHRGYNSVDIY